MNRELLDQASQTCSKALGTLNGCIDRLIEAIEGPMLDDGGNPVLNADGDQIQADYDKDAVVHLTWLTQQVIAIIGSIRSLPPTKTDSKSGDLQDMFRS